MRSIIFSEHFSVPVVFISVHSFLECHIRFKVSFLLHLFEELWILSFRFCALLTLCFEARTVSSLFVKCKSTCLHLSDTLILFSLSHSRDTFVIFLVLNLAFSQFFHLSYFIESRGIKRHIWTKFISFLNGCPIFIILLF